MRRFDLAGDYEADCHVAERFRVGAIYHCKRNRDGGAVLTPVARFFCWRPHFTEGFHEHWRVDCYVRDHKLAPSPDRAGRDLVVALLREEICTEPIWVSSHTASEVKGEAFGDVFDLD